jgi:type I restriction enzyme R subunit
MLGGTRDESEARTRRSRAAPMLKQQGWRIVPFDPTCPTRHYSHHAVTEFPTAKGPADYVLFVDGCPLGIVEAKRLSVGPQNVLPQAEPYSLQLAFG